MSQATRHLGTLPLFAPGEGEIVRTPPGTGKGNWVGAPSALYDEETERYYLCYRRRRPRGNPEGDRGYEFCVAVGTDGVQFTDIWSVRRSELGSPSIERGFLLKGTDDVFRLYLSYVDPADNRWVIDLLEANDPAKFRIAERHRILTPDAVPGAQSIKDPFVLSIGGLYYMYVNTAVPRPEYSSEGADLHASADVHTTGKAPAPTQLLVSGDGRCFTWVREVLSTSADGWDACAARITSIVWTGSCYVALYDGMRIEEWGEAKAGLAVSLDLERFTKVTSDAPALTSPHGEGSLRYIEALPLTDAILYYYEFTRPDGSHDLRVARVPWQRQ